MDDRVPWLPWEVLLLRKLREKDPGSQKRKPWNQTSELFRRESIRLQVYQRSKQSLQQKWTRLGKEGKRETPYVNRTLALWLQLLNILDESLKIGSNEENGFWDTELEPQHQDHAMRQHPAPWMVNVYLGASAKTSQYLENGSLTFGGKIQNEHPDVSCSILDFPTSYRQDPMGDKGGINFNDFGEGTYLPQWQCKRLPCSPRNNPRVSPAFQL